MNVKLEGAAKAGRQTNSWTNNLLNATYLLNAT